MNVHQDEALALLRVAALRRFFPKARIAIVGDGPTGDDGFIAACFDRGATVVTPGVRLKVPERGGAWTERWLRHGTSLGTDVIVKLDPDTGVFAHAEFPDVEVFGALMHGPLRPHGSLVGIRRDVAKKVLKSGMLADAEYVTHADRYLYRRPPDPQWRSCQDLIFGDVLDRLGIATTAYPGIVLLRDERPPGLAGLPPHATFAHSWRE